MTPASNERHKRAFLIWLAIYPLITAMFYLFGDRLAPLPVFVRTFILTGLAVPMVVYIILPLYMQWFRKWLTTDSGNNTK